MNQNNFRHIFLKISFCLICLLSSSSVVLAQNKPSAATQTEAQKVFEKMKSLSGSWQGTIMGISINLTIRPISSDTAILYEAHTSNGGPPNHEITIFYMDGDRLLATHYCDAGNRARLEGKMSQDGKTSEFNFLDVAGSTKGGLIRRMAFTIVDANKHIEDFTFVMPNGKAVELRGEFERTK